MTYVQDAPASYQLTFRQRWGHYLALLFGLFAIYLGLNLRDNTLNATTIYNNPQAGIAAEYPLNWLLEESGDYIFRVRDINAPGFDTTIQVAAQAIGPDTSPRNVFDALTLARASLAGYNVIASDNFRLPDDTVTSAMTYSYVQTEVNPFLQNIPTVVQGIDVLVLARGQAIIISFLSDARTYDANFYRLQQFLESLEL
jgi:hypothetical protein